MTTALLDRTTLIVNAGSRTGARSLDRARTGLEQNGVRLVHVEPVTDPATIPDVVRSRAGDSSLVVVGGGDGTIGCVAGVLAELLAGERPVLGVLPLGTANDFARTLDISGDLDEACRVIGTGKVVDVDLGRANGSPFVNVASLGLSVGSAGALRPGLKRALGPAAYPVSAIVAYRRHQPFGLRLEFPDSDHQPFTLTDLLQVTIGNGRYYGGGHAIAPDAGIDDHSLDFHAIKAGRLWDHVSLARLVRDGSLIEHEDVRHLVTRRLRLETDRPQAVNLDGEVVTRSPVEVHVERNAFEVVVPQHVRHVSYDGG